MGEATWLWVQRCGVAGETNEVFLTDVEKAQIEAQPGFVGWELDEIVPVEPTLPCPACDGRGGMRGYCSMNGCDVDADCGMCDGAGEIAA